MKPRRGAERRFFYLPQKTRGSFYLTLHELIALSVFALLVFVSLRSYLPHLQAAGLDSITVTLLDSESVNTDSQVQVAFEVGNLSDGETIDIYLGEDTTGDEWQDDGITNAHISCSDDGAGEAYAGDAVNAATASDAMNVTFTATTVGAGATTVTCLIGDGDANNPNNPNAAYGFSVAVITSEDAGAGIAYVGNANDITVSVSMLSNLSLSIDNADGTYCTTVAGVTSCNLGVVLTTTVAQGSYDLNVGTNAQNGATLQINSSGALLNGAEDIAAYIEDSGAITAGTEEYGIDVAADAAWTKAGDFSDDATPVPAVETAIATTAGENDIAGDDLTITHKAAIDSTVLARTYSQIVTWTASASF